MLKATTSWVLTQIPMIKIIKYWLVGLSAMFLDWDGLVGADIRNGVDQLSMYWPRVFVSAGVIGALIFMCRRAPNRGWMLPLILIGTSVGGLMLPDLLTGGQRSIAARYFLGVYIAFQIAVAYLFSVKLIKRSIIWKIIFGIVIMMQIMSCGTILQSAIWWNKDVNILAVVEEINRSDKPFIITESGGVNPGTLIAMSYRVKPETLLQLADLENIPEVPKGYSDVFIFTTTVN
jgi:hypothetical protein